MNYQPDAKNEQAFAAQVFDTTETIATTKPSGHRHQPPAENDEAGQHAKPVLVDARAAKRLYNFSRSFLYRETADGRLEAVKMRGRVFWTVASIEARIAAAARPDLKYLTAVN